MHKEIEDTLRKVDARCRQLSPAQLQEEFSGIPLTVFGEIQIDRPSEFPNLMAWLPEMPTAEVQNSWNGADGRPLLEQSLSFVRTVVTGYHAVGLKPISEANMLDFGCGWGRLVRLLYKYIPTTQIYGVDAREDVIRLCSKLHGSFYVSERVPRTLPTPNGLKFDFIIAFSVFTHLSEKVTIRCIQTLRDYLADSGVIALTIRPREYWSHLRNSDCDVERIVADHDVRGFAFRPHGWEPIDGDIPYGDSSMSLDYIARSFSGLEIAGLEWNPVDELQLTVFLRKVKRSS